MKNFFITNSNLATTTCANAVNWHRLTQIFQTLAYIDTDTINNGDSDKSIYYAIKYQSGFNPEQVAYVKSTIKIIHIELSITGL